MGHIDIVADLALDRDISHEPLHRLGVDAGQIAGIGVSVGVAIPHVEEQDKVVAAVGVGGNGIWHG